MRKIKLFVAGITAAVLLAVPTAFVGASEENNLQAEKNAPDVSAAAPSLPCRRQSAENGAGKDLFLSTASPYTYTGTAWQDVACAGSTFRLNYNQRALVTSDFNAEADCNGPTTSGQWCQTRALLNGVEGAPVAAEPSSFAFDSVAGGANNWQAHAMNRAWEVRCGVSSGCQYRVQVQTRMHDSSVTGMWLDEVANHVSVVVGNPAPL